MNLLNFFTVISYIALNVDVLFQIRQIHRTKSSKDLSLVGLFIRYIAILIILVKFLSLSDISLIMGQGLLVFTFTTYFIFAVYYSVYRKVKS